MVNLILVILSISLTAATLFASMNYLPGWTSSAADAHQLTRHGFVTLEKAFQASLSRTEGAAPAPTVDSDGGLATNFSADYGYLPNTPKGYSWKYGFNGTDYYLCLYPQAAGGASEALWRGMKRARSVLSDQQYFLLPGGVASCDTPSPASMNLVADPEDFPTSVSAVYLLRYTPPVPEPAPEPAPAPAPAP